MVLIRGLLASVYFWAAFSKLRPDWLDGRALALFHRDGALSGWFADFVLATPTSRALAACAIALTELSLPALLFWRRTRKYAPFVALSMHASIELAAHPDLLGVGDGGAAHLPLAAHERRRYQRSYRSLDVLTDTPRDPQATQ